MTEVWFYHLEHRPLDEVLPILLERTLQRGWRAVVQADSRERVEALDQLLWTYSDDSFLPHGTAGDGEPASQPVYLTDGAENPNGATVRFCLEPGSLTELMAGADAAAYTRVMLIFDGRDDAAVGAARRQWSALKQAGHALSYWQQTDEGRWEKRG